MYMIKTRRFCKQWRNLCCVEGNYLEITLVHKWPIIYILLYKYYGITYCLTWWLWHYPCILCKFKENTIETRKISNVIKNWYDYNYEIDAQYNQVPINFVFYLIKCAINGINRCILYYRISRCFIYRNSS